MPRVENRPSLLLTREENDQVFGLIGPKCQSLATAVVQLFTTEPPDHYEWRKKDTGILCLIKDNAKRSYFFRIYCLYRKTMVWEHEVYTQIEYKNPKSYLHTFEAEEYMTAFNFANEDEARALRNMLIEKIELRKQRREDRRQRSTLASRANSGIISQNSYGSNSYVTPVRQNGATPAAAPPPPPAPVPQAQPLKTTHSGSGYKAKGTGKKPKTRKLTKADIGAPENFKHVSHVGWDINRGFDVDVNNMAEEEMRSFFRQAGISDTQLQDHATREFIYEFINTHGGIDAVKEELTVQKPQAKSSSGRSQPPPAPAPPAPPVPSRSPAPPAPPAPPGPPSRAPPPPPARSVPPPPPPPAPAPAPPKNPPPPRPSQPPVSAPPAAPPPPPPPPPAAPPAPPPPPAPSSTASSMSNASVTSSDAAIDPRAALMESIRNGNKNLKKVEVAAKPAVVEDSRNNLLSEIRQGVELKAVSREASNATSERRQDPSGLAGALARALEERNRAIHSSDDDEDDDTTSDGEWED